jgi:hypothetical protein
MAADLLIYDETANGIPVAARYPETMRVMGTGSGSGEGICVFFTFEPQGNSLDDAQVHVFLTCGAASTAALEPFVAGPNGLLVSNEWTEEGFEEGGSEQFPYSWVEKIIDFSTEMQQSGHLLLGQAHGQAIQVTLHLEPDGSVSMELDWQPRDGGETATQAPFESEPDPRLERAIRDASPDYTQESVEIGGVQARYLHARFDLNSDGRHEIFAFEDVLPLSARHSDEAPGT